MLPVFKDKKFEQILGEYSKYSMHYNNGERQPNSQSTKLNYDWLCGTSSLYIEIFVIHTHTYGCNMEESTIWVD